MPEERSLAGLVHDVRQGWRILAVSIVVGVLVGVVATTLQSPQYRARGSVLVSPARFLDPSGTDALPALTDTIVELASREAVLGPTASAYIDAAPAGRTRDRRAREATLGWLQRNLLARRVGTSSVIDMSATASTGRDAQDLARAFVSSLTRFVRDARTTDAPTSGTPAGGAGVVRLGAAELVGKTSPTPLRNVLIGLNASLVVGLIVALARGSRRRAATPAQAAAELGVPSLGSVRSGVRGPGEGVLAAQSLLEAVSAPTGRLVALLTGTVRPDAIAEVAEILARSLQGSGHRALAIDADREHSALTRRVGAGGRPGLSALLDGSVDETEADRFVLDADAGEATGSPELPVLPIGPQATGSALQPQRLRSVLDDLQIRFDVIVISGPSLGPNPDLPVLISAADCWLLVTDTDASARGLGDARVLMNGAPRPVMGTLSVNGAGDRVRAAAH